MHAKQPSLPSIQSLLPEDAKLAPTVSVQQQRTGHRSTRSVSSLPTELQHLSIYGPALTDTSPTSTPPPDTATPMINNKALSNMKPSWMRNSGQPHQPHRTTTTTSPLLTQSHAKSVTEVDRPSTVGGRKKTTSIPSYSSPSQHQITPFAARDSAATTAFTPFSPPRIRSLPIDQPRPSYQPIVNAPPPPSSTTQNRKLHRRAASANNIDYMLQHSLDHSLSINKSSSKGLTTVTTSNNDGYSASYINQRNGMANKTAAMASMPLASSSATSRYMCPYCQKRFSRPSSLRIHTYSHSGEKPFICPEIGCGRRFSVQSNQRRHLRVHRLTRHTSTNSALGGIM
ncbi:unnamed protein product [Absidia cylindrospora]